MNRTLLLFPLFFISLFSISYSQNFNTGKALTGDTALSCEAILCLASPTTPAECVPSLNYYFGLSARKWKDVVTKRKNFLNLCPTSNSENDSLLESIGISATEQAMQMNGFKNVVIDMPHDCTSQSLNKEIESTKLTRDIYEMYVDRLLENQTFPNDYYKQLEKRRLSSQWYSKYADKEDRPDVYRVNTVVPRACERFYLHQWVPSRPEHNGNYNWYFKEEFSYIPPAVWY